MNLITVPITYDPDGAISKLTDLLAKGYVIVGFSVSDALDLLSVTCADYPHACLAERRRIKDLTNVLYTLTGHSDTDHTSRFREQAKPKVLPHKSDTCEVCEIPQQEYYLMINDSKYLNEYVGWRAKFSGYPPAGYGFSNPEVFMENGTYYCSWNHRNSCD